MESNQFFLNLALILLSTKLLGLFSRRLNMPQVVGALLAGLLLGPAGFHLLQETEFIKTLAELGVVVLMFSAGLETDVVELRRAGRASLVIALCGVTLSLAGGTAVAWIFNRGALSEGGSNVLLQNIFLGVTLASTSVSITVESLRELGKLDTRAGSAILGAALIDDILGVIALTVVSSLADSGVSLWTVLLKLALFFVFLAAVGFLVTKLFSVLIRQFRNDMRRFAILAFVLCLGFAYAAERFFGVADITGAYFAGLLICNTQKTKYIASRFSTLSFLLLSPIFFASIGLSVSLADMSLLLFLFAGALLVVSMLTKALGCGLGARLCGYSGEDSLQIGVGMMSRGEVSLIGAARGSALGLMSTAFYAPIIVMVIATTILTPILLKIIVSRQPRENRYADLVESRLVDRYQETEQLDLAQQTLLDMHEEYFEQGKKEPPQPPRQRKTAPAGKNDGENG